MEKKLPIYKATVEDGKDTGIFAVSFVDYPAIERNFVALHKSQRIELKIDKQKRLLTGPVLIPDVLIYRHDAKGEYYLTFTTEDIEKIALKMMRDGIALTNTTHQHKKNLTGNYLAELWIVKDSKKDKSVVLGLGELPVGSLVASYKIEDAKYWTDEVLTGNVKGFSLEGLFNFNNIRMSKKEKTAAELAKDQAAAKKKKSIPTFFKAIATFLEGSTEEAEAVVDEAKKDETDSGTPYLIFELADGGEVYVDESGFCTLDGEQMPAGEHALADGNFIVVDDKGELVITQPEADGQAPAEADVVMAKQRAKAFLKSQSPMQKRIAKLEKELAELKKQPSAPPASPAVDGAGTKRPEEMTRTEKMADILRSRNQRTN